MGFLFEKLEVYKRAVEFADKALSISNKFPRGQSVMADQLKRAAVSIPLNIAEGSGRWHRKEKRQFYLISRGSVYECVAALDLCFRQRLLDAAVREELNTDLERLSQMLTKLIQAVA